MSRRKRWRQLLTLIGFKLLGDRLDISKKTGRNFKIISIPSLLIIFDRGEILRAQKYLRVQNGARWYIWKHSRAIAVQLSPKVIGPLPRIKDIAACWCRWMASPIFSWPFSNDGSCQRQQHIILFMGIFDVTWPRCSWKNITICGTTCSLSLNILIQVAGSTRPLCVVRYTHTSLTNWRLVARLLNWSNMFFVH